MTASELKHRLLRQLQYEQKGSAPDFVQEDVVIGVNAAFQLLWTAVPETERAHYTRSDRNISVVSGNGEYTFPSDVQNVLPPVHVQATGRPLYALNHKTEVLQYNLQRRSGESSSGTPRHFFIESKAASTNDATTTKLFLRPVPDAAFTLVANVETEAPRFELDDFCDDPQPTLPVPHAYVESLLLPVALAFVAQSHWFQDEAKRATIEASAENALQRVGVTNPQIWRAQESADQVA